MDFHDQIPILVLHVLEADIPQDSSVIDQHIDAAVVLDRSVNDGLAILDRVVVGDGLAASLADLIDDLVGGLSHASQYASLRTICRLHRYRRATTLTLEATTEVVDDHIGTSRCEEDRIHPSESSSSTSDHDSLTVVP